MLSFFYMCKSREWLVIRLKRNYLYKFSLIGTWGSLNFKWLIKLKIDVWFGLYYIDTNNMP